MAANCRCGISDARSAARPAFDKSRLGRAGGQNTRRRASDVCIASDQQNAKPAAIARRTAKPESITAPQAGIHCDAKTMRPALDERQRCGAARVAKARAPATAPQTLSVIAALARTPLAAGRARLALLGTSTTEPPAHPGGRPPAARTRATNGSASSALSVSAGAQSVNFPARKSSTSPMNVSSNPCTAAIAIANSRRSRRVRSHVSSSTGPVSHRQRPSRPHSLRTASSRRRRCQAKSGCGTAVFIRGLSSLFNPIIVCYQSKRKLSTKIFVLPGEFFPFQDRRRKHQG